MKILVPLDGSTFAERALPIAAALASADGVEVVLVRVVPVIGPGGKEPGVVSYLDEHRIETSLDYLRHASAILRLGRPVATEADVAPDVVTGILERATSGDVDLIVMTSHGESWPAASVLGTTASRLIREATCPVLVVGPRAGVPKGSPLASGYDEPSPA